MQLCNLPDSTEVYGRFNYVIWPSLQEAPLLDKILVQRIPFHLNQQETAINLPARLCESIIHRLH
jgi:hypothetical protein